MSSVIQNGLRKNIALIKMKNAAHPLIKEDDTAFSLSYVRSIRCFLRTELLPDGEDGGEQLFCVVFPCFFEQRSRLTGK